MQIPKPTENGSFELTPAGTHVAICYRFIDKGTQANEFMGEKKIRHEVMLTWELPDELMSDGRPFSVSRSYTWSMHEKSTLRRDLESWRGMAFTDSDFDGPKAFDTRNLLGKACMLQVVHETRGEKTFSKITSVGKLTKGISVPAQTNPNAYLALTKDRWDASVYAGLSDKMKEIIAASPEYKEITMLNQRHDDPGPGHDLDDEIPF